MLFSLNQLSDKNLRRERDVNIFKQQIYSFIINRTCETWEAILAENNKNLYTADNIVLSLSRQVIYCTKVNDLLTIDCNERNNWLLQHIAPPHLMEHFIYIPIWHNWKTKHLLKGIFFYWLMYSFYDFMETFKHTPALYWIWKYLSFYGSQYLDIVYKQWSVRSGQIETEGYRLD